MIFEHDHCPALAKVTSETFLRLRSPRVLAKSSSYVSKAQSPSAWPRLSEASSPTWLRSGTCRTCAGAVTEYLKAARRHAPLLRQPRDGLTEGIGAKLGRGVPSRDGAATQPRPGGQSRRTQNAEPRAHPGPPAAEGRVERPASEGRAERAAAAAWAGPRHRLAEAPRCGHSRLARKCLTSTALRCSSSPSCLYSAQTAVPALPPPGPRYVPAIARTFWQLVSAGLPSSLSRRCPVRLLMLLRLKNVRSGCPDGALASLGELLRTGTGLRG